MKDSENLLVSSLALMITFLIIDALTLEKDGRMQSKYMQKSQESNDKSSFLF